MSTSMHVSALRDMDGKFKQMLEIKNLCDSYNVSYPQEVIDYFGEGVCKAQDEDYLRDELCEIDLDNKLREWSDGPGGYRGGYEINVSDIPSEAKTMRFYLAC